MKLGCIAIVLVVGVVGCTSQPFATPPVQTREQREAQIDVAFQSVKGGRFDSAEKLLAP